MLCLDSLGINEHIGVWLFGGRYLHHPPMCPDLVEFPGPAVRAWSERYGKSREAASASAAHNCAGRSRYERIWHRRCWHGRLGSRRQGQERKDSRAILDEMLEMQRSEKSRASGQSPDPINQPVVPLSKGWRRPRSGNSPRRTLSETPTL